MTKTARVYKIEMLIRNRGHVSFRALLEELEVSPATLKRDLEYLKDQLGAPIKYDWFLNGYRFGRQYRGQRHELPGLWFKERKLYSLLMTHLLLSDLDGQGTTLSRNLQPVLQRVHELLGTSDVEASENARRVRIISPARRPVSSKFFELIGEALAKRRRVSMRYLTRGRGQVGDREISSQRRVHYRGTCYVDVRCHRSEGLRRFALDAVEEASLLERRAKDASLEQVEAEMDGGYGIYAGNKRRWATLVFQAQAAQWVGREQWHREQAGCWLDDGRYELRVPFADISEIAMDAMRHSDQVQVRAPADLAAYVARAQARATALYAAGLTRPPKQHPRA